MGYCIMCDDTGVYLKPNNENAYNKAFDYYDNMGIFNLDETRKRALDDVGYTRLTPCPRCGKSSNYKK